MRDELLVENGYLAVEDQRRRLEGPDSGSKLRGTDDYDPCPPGYALSGPELWDSFSFPPSEWTEDSQTPGYLATLPNREDSSSGDRTGVTSRALLDS